jgi:hypothetical protein
MAIQTYPDDNPHLPIKAQESKQIFLMGHLSMKMLWKWACMRKT